MVASAVINRLESDLAVAEDLEALAIEDGAPADAPGPDVLEDTYPNWSPDTSHVISGPLGPRAKFKGARFDHWALAKEAALANHRTVYKFWTLGARWFARVGNG